ncbi:MAG TPA: metallophosphoesterase family protein [Actinospica sp.]|jgi:predicted phosphodiesterase|nr:metallophosphoesterase family protein [Actinospica sp.]
MRLAVVTDIHGNTAGLYDVLARAARLGVDGVVGMGDVLECRVGKRDSENHRYRRIEDVFDQDAELATLLRSAILVRGNQEERIRALVPEHEVPGWAARLLDAPLEHRTPFGVYRHGHPGPWQEVEPGRWCQLDAEFRGRALMHGHHHRSAVYRLPARGRAWAATEVIDFDYGVPVPLHADRQYVVNVGSVRGPRPEWALVDEAAATVTFHRTTTREAG